LKPKKAGHLEFPLRILPDPGNTVERENKKSEKSLLLPEVIAKVAAQIRTDRLGSAVFLKRIRKELPTAGPTG
jgi:hypothetical protein